MADVQCENGYTRIADALLEALCRTAIPARHFNVLLAVIRLTYGFGKTEDRIALSQIEALTGIDRRNIHATLAGLEAAGMIERDDPGEKRTRRIRVVKDFSRWESVMTRDDRSVIGRDDRANPHSASLLLTDLSSGETHTKERKRCCTKSFQRTVARKPGRSRKLKIAPPQEAFDLAALLADVVVKRLGHGKPRVLRPWAEEIAKLYAKGAGPPWTEIENTIYWLYSDENEGQYRFVVQSGRSLREKYLRIREAIAQREVKRETPMEANQREIDTWANE